MQVHLAINKKHREADKMSFINHRVNHTLNKTFRLTTEKFDLKYFIPGTYFRDTPHFAEVIYVIVGSSVRSKDRKLKVGFTASPTGSFARRLRNVNTANTRLDMQLDSRIQLRLDL
jgi:hypothetical protein